MPFRLWKKSVKMILRDRRTFFVFCLMYTGLILLTSYSLELALYGAAAESGTGNLLFLVSLFVSLSLAILYAWLIVSRNRRTWATLKCIGYTNGNVNSLVLGQIIFTTVMGLVIVIEALFHYNAILVYVLPITNPSINVADIPFVTLIPVIVTCGMFILVQVLGYLVMRGKITKVRPMIALKRVGE